MPSTFCWYFTAADVAAIIADPTAKNKKRCLEKYNTFDNVEFGWKPKFNDLFKDTIFHGQFCKSGWAVESATNTAKCVSITKVESDLGEQSGPYTCTATNTDNRCKYFYDNNIVNSLDFPCECSFDGKPGYCPRPG
jgi:hypothetical protein